MSDISLKDYSLEGVNLIEASAGTGKTYTLSLLVLRILLEKENVDLRNILVVTFTRAATAELKERIRKFLKIARDCVSGKNASADHVNPQIAEIVDNAKSLYQDESELLQRIDFAVLNFDEASIYTIHAFCQRVLQQYSFESGSISEVEMITDQEDLVREAAEDFWRRRIFNEWYCFLH